MQQRGMRELDDAVEMLQRCWKCFLKGSNGQEARLQREEWIGSSDGGG